MTAVDLYAEDVRPREPIPYTLTPRGEAKTREPVPALPPRPRSMRSAALLGCPARRTR